LHDLTHAVTSSEVMTLRLHRNGHIIATCEPELCRTSPVRDIQYATSHPGQLSLAIPSWVGAMGHLIKKTTPDLTPELTPEITPNYVN